MEIVDGRLSEASDDVVPHETQSRTSSLSEKSSPGGTAESNGSEEEQEMSQVEFSEDDEDSEDEEEDPPIFQFNRMTQIPKTFFKRDSISTCLFSDSLFAFATHSGLLHLTKPDLTTIRTFKCHRSSILSINTDGKYFATGSIDGTVVIGSINDPQEISGYDFKRPIHAVVLDKAFETSKTFVSGGMAGEVILTQRNWLGNRTDTVLEKNHGAIVGIYTIDDVLLWMNDNGITFYSTLSKAKLLNVPYPQGEEDRPDLYWPKVTFPETDRIIVCWGKHIWQFKVSISKNAEFNKNLGSFISSAASSLRGTPDRKVEQEHHIKLPYLVAGTAAFRDDQLLCLGITKSSTNRLEPPELKIISMMNGEEFHSYQVISKSFQNVSLNDFHLGGHIGFDRSEFYLISPTDAIVAKELSLLDRFNWFVEKKKFLKAWEIGEYAVSPMERFLAGLEFIDMLISCDKWEDASKQINLIFNQTPETEEELSNFKQSKWGMYLMNFVKHDKTDLIVHVVPTTNALDQNIYTSILLWYLKNNRNEFVLSLTKTWETSLYDKDAVICAIEDKLESEENDQLRRCLAEVYLRSNDFLPAANQLIILRDPFALDILLQHNLLSNFVGYLRIIVLLPLHGDISSLEKMSLTEVKNVFSKSMNLLLENRHSIPIETIIKELSTPLRVLLFLFLQSCMKVEPLMLSGHEDLLLELYIEFDQPDLLEFLKSKSNYDTDLAISLCQSNPDLHNELIYLWSKIGENKKALSLIIDSLDDPKLAFQFVKDSQDNELWEFLINYSLNKPKFIKAILESAELFEDEIATIVDKMPDDIEVDGLKASLEKITTSNELTLGVMNSIFKIVDDETKQVVAEFLMIRKKGKLM